MRRPGRLLRAYAIASLVLGGIGAGHAKGRECPLVVGYLASWTVGAKTVEIADIPAHRLSHIAYAFAGISPEGLAILSDPCGDAGECLDEQSTGFGGRFAELAALKQRYPHLKVLISIGGWTGSTYFSDAAASEESRQRFAASAIDLFILRFPGLFDGIDLDWEFPVEGGVASNIHRPEDRENFALLAAEFRRQLDETEIRTSGRYSLSIAATADRVFIDNLDLETLRRYLDWIGVMTYDYHAGSDVAAFNAPLFPTRNDPDDEANVDASLQAFIAAGVPASQLLLGIPLYGRVYVDVKNQSHGLLQPAKPMPDGELWQSIIDYREIVRRRLAETGFAQFWDDQAKMPWLHDASAGIWISYDDPRSVREKARYAEDRELGGMMVWELTGDNGELLRTVEDEIGCFEHDGN